MIRLFDLHITDWFEVWIGIKNNEEFIELSVMVDLWRFSIQLPVRWDK